MSKTAERLVELGVPNTFLARTVYRTTHKLAYITLYTGIMVASIVTRKDRLELINSVNAKLGIDPVTPDQ